VSKVAPKTPPTTKTIHKKWKGERKKKREHQKKRSHKLGEGKPKKQHHGGRVIVKSAKKVTKGKKIDSIRKQKREGTREKSG